MAGREPKKVFVYGVDGTYICMFDNMVEFRKVYYPADTGKRPLFNHEELGVKYHYMLDLELIAVTTKSVGRDALKRIIAIHESEYCKKEDLSSDKKPVLVYNLKNECIAEFKNTRLLHKLMPHILPGTVSNQLNSTTLNPKSHNELGLYFVYKT
jgi:hypothetical protein